MPRRPVLAVLGAVMVALVAATAITWFLPARPRRGRDPWSGRYEPPGQTDWDLVVRDGIDLAYIKATEGRAFLDARFHANWNRARQAGLEVGAYHFFTLCSPGADQAEHFLVSVVLEQSEVAAFIDTAAAGTLMVLYVSNRFDQEYGVIDRFDRDVWERRILRRPTGSEWVIWQFGYRSCVAGIDGGVDLNIMRSPLPAT